MSNALIMVIVGTILMISELAFANFVLIFFGLGFLVSGFIGFVYFLGWEWQILLAFILSIIFLFALKKRIKALFEKSSEKIKDNFLDEGGIGEFKNGMIYFKGTFWQCGELDELIKNGLKEGDKVEILGTKDNKVKIKVKKI